MTATVRFKKADPHAWFVHINDNVRPLGFVARDPNGWVPYFRTCGDGYTRLDGVVRTREAAAQVLTDYDNELRKR